MSAAMKLDAERALFEAEYGPRDGFSWRNEDGSYKIASLQLAWEIWQKRAALDTSTPPQSELSALPELPELPDDPAGVCEVYVGKFEAYGVVVDRIECADGYSADQMRAYGLLCRQSGDAADKRDAERYRTLRDVMHTEMPIVHPPMHPEQGYVRDGLDRAIDNVIAAIAQQREGGNAS